MTLATTVRLAAALLLAGTHCGAVLAAVPVPASAPGTTGGHLSVFGAPATAAHAGSRQRLDGALADIALRSASLNRGTALASLHAINPAARFRLSPPLATPEVLVDAISPADPQALVAALSQLGMEHVAVYANDVGGWLPVNQLAAAAVLPELRHLRASMPRTRSGAVTSQGDFVTHAELVRSSKSLSGSGVTVGVLSDSFNCYATYAGEGLPAAGTTGYANNGFTADYATDIGSGDLPANVDVVKDATCMDYGAPQQLPFTDEGRAILQIVHDLAPGASLAFYTAEDSEADFASGIVKLASTGAKVIDDDVGYFDEPFFQDGLVAQAVDQVEAQGVSYFSSAGNNGSNSYENTAPAFPTVAASGPNAGEKLLNFDSSGETTATALPLNIPQLQPGEFLALVLEWDQPYVTGAPGSPGSANSLDLCVSGNSADQLDDADGNAMASGCTGANSVGSDPVQVLIIGIPANASGNTASENITVSIGLAGGTAPGRVKFVLADDGAGSTINAYATNSPTIQGHPGAAGAAAVAAAFYYDTPACASATPVLESFSSKGGDPILFDTTGKRLATPTVRQKPDFTGPDGVNNTFLGFEIGNPIPASTVAGCDNATNYPSFFGTSAAAPHAAAIAALMLQANPADTPSQIYSAFDDSAISTVKGASSPNATAGYGFIQADAAIALLPKAASASGGSGGGSSGGGFDSWTLLGLGVLVLTGFFRKAHIASQGG